MSYMSYKCNRNLTLSCIKNVDDRPEHAIRMSYIHTYTYIHVIMYSVCTYMYTCTYMYVWQNCIIIVMYSNIHTGLPKFHMYMYIRTCYVHCMCIAIHVYTCNRNCESNILNHFHCEYAHTQFYYSQY